MRHFMASPATPLGGVAKTSMGTISVPKSAKRITGIWGYALGGAGHTTLENVSGILTIESDDLSVKPCQIPIDVLAIVGTGVAILKPTVWPHSIGGVGNTDLTGYITLDLAQSITGKGRWGLIYED